MMTVDFTSSPDMPMASASCSSAASRIADDRLLDAEVDDLVAVVGQDDVDQVLADVVHVALHGGQHDAALAAVRRSSPCAARGRRPRSSSPRRTGARTAAASAPEPNSSPTVFIPASSVSLMISSAGSPLPAPRRGRPPARCARRRRCAAASRSSSGSASSSAARAALADGGGHALEQLDEALQRVVALAPPVVDHVERDLRAARRGSAPSAGSWSRARSPSPGRPRRTRAGTPS